MTDGVTTRWRQWVGRAAGAFWLVVALALVPALAQDGVFRVGVVLSLSGSAASLGQAQQIALELALQDASRRRLGQRPLLFIRDDGGRAVEAVRQARSLVEEEGVHALICCSSDEVSRSLRDYAEGARVLTLSLARLPDAEPGFWFYSLLPDDRRLLQSVVLKQADAGQARFGLMTPETDFGEATARSLGILFGPESGTYFVVDERYSPTAAALTPEALWVATRLPETVLLWGAARDTERGYRALRDRGYEGDVVINPALLEPSVGLRLGSLEGALAPVSPAAVGRSLAPEHLNYGLVQQYLGQMARRVAAAPPEAAYAYDALNLLLTALEQAFTYGVPMSDPALFRGVLRDAFIGMGPVAGASGSFDFVDGESVGVLPRSLALARLQGGRLEAAE